MQAIALDIMLWMFRQKSADAVVMAVALWLPAYRFFMR
jgi:hypothetical protein